MPLAKLMSRGQSLSPGSVSAERGAAVPNSSKKPVARKTRTVNMDADLHQMVSFIVLHRGISMTEYLTSVMEKQVGKDYAETLKQLWEKQKSSDQK